MILLQIISVLIVVSALIAALIIGLDLTRRRQPMRIMNPVWILTTNNTFPSFIFSKFFL